VRHIEQPDDFWHGHFGAEGQGAGCINSLWGMGEIFILLEIEKAPSRNGVRERTVLSTTANRIRGDIVASRLPRVSASADSTTEEDVSATLDQDRQRTGPTAKPQLSPVLNRPKKGEDVRPPIHFVVIVQNWSKVHPWHGGSDPAADQQAGIDLRCRAGSADTGPRSP